jgi:lipoate-protein ligase B
MLESVIIRMLAAFKVRAFREHGQSGVWVFDHQRSFVGLSEGPGPESGVAQIAAIGVKLNQQHITSHGFSINVNPDLKFFDWIIPCGLPGCRITSLQQVLNPQITIGSVLEPVIESFCEVFEMERVIPVRMATKPAMDKATLYR